MLFWGLWILYGWNQERLMIRASRNNKMKEKVISNLYWILQQKIETEISGRNITYKICQMLPVYVCTSVYIKGEYHQKDLLMSIIGQILIYCKGPEISWFHPTIWLIIFTTSPPQITFINNTKGVLSFFF